MIALISIYDQCLREADRNFSKLRYLGTVNFQLSINISDKPCHSVPDLPIGSIG